MSIELAAVEYSKVDNINSKDIKFKPARTIVFRQYLDYLTKGDIKQRIRDFNPGRYHIYTFPIVPGISNSRKWKWKPNNSKDIYNLEQYAGTDIGCLKTVTTVTVDKDILISSGLSYEQLLNIPVSGWLFSTKRPFNSYIKEDYNYMACNYSPVAYKLSRVDYNKVLAEHGFNFDYWGTNYDFTSGYDHEDYLSYGIRETELKDNMTRMSSDPCDYEVKKLTTKTAALVIAYHRENMKVPVIYTELHNSFYSTGGVIRIEWSQNGIITVT